MERQCSQFGVQGYRVRAVVLGVNNNDNFNINANNNIDNNRPALGIAFMLWAFLMKTYNRLYERLISLDNLEDAYWKARSHKSNNSRIIEFDKHQQLHLAVLDRELKDKTYQPQQLRNFVLRDPKTRIISVSEFRDRIVHHALVNILQPIFEPRFIYDSYASRKGKGTLAAIKRFDRFMHKVTKNGKLLALPKTNNDVQGYALKADIRHYFDSVDHKILIRIISQRITDKGVLWLVKAILENYSSGESGKGMPLGNWTSQFLANVYLNELDYYIKFRLKAKFYIRYVDDFVILHRSKTVLRFYLARIESFLHTLKLELHPDKCRIIPFAKGISFLGYLIFYKYRRLRQRNVRKIFYRLKSFAGNDVPPQNTALEAIEMLNGWNAYAIHANTYRLRCRLAELLATQLSQIGGLQVKL